MELIWMNVTRAVGILAVQLDEPVFVAALVSRCFVIFQVQMAQAEVKRAPWAQSSCFVGRGS